MVGVLVCTLDTHLLFRPPGTMKNQQLVGPELINSLPQKYLAYFTTEGCMLRQRYPYNCTDLYMSKEGLRRQKSKKPQLYGFRLILGPSQYSLKNPLFC